MLAIIDVDTSSSYAVLGTALRRANNAMVGAYRNLVPHGEDEDETYGAWSSAHRWMPGGRRGPDETAADETGAAAAAAAAKAAAADGKAGGAAAPRRC